MNVYGYFVCMCAQASSLSACINCLFTNKCFFSHGSIQMVKFTDGIIMECLVSNNNGSRSMVQGKIGYI